MPYVTTSEFAEALANAGGAGSRTAAALPEHRLEANLEEATAETVGALAGFALPPDGGDAAAPMTPPLLRTIIVGIAGYLATLEFYGSQALEERDPVALRYARARELLKAVTGGTLAVEGIEAKGDDSPSTVGGAPAIYQGPGGAVGLADGWLEDSRHGHPSSPPYFGGVVWG